MEKQEKLVLIDGNSLLNRAFYALPLLTNSNGEYSNAIYGFCNILIKLIENEKPKYMAVAFDLGQPTFRHKLYADYKAGRKKMPDELAAQFPMLKSILSAMNVSIFEQPGIEADDLVGTLAKKFDVQTIIVSGDRDLFQLVDNTTSVWFTKRGITETIVVTPENIKQVYGVEASQVVDLKSLMGDSSDNIKGVAGIGEKTAKSLIETYGTLENIYEHIEDFKGATKQKLQIGKGDAFLSQTLATINTNVELSVDISDLEYDFPFKKSVYEIFNQLEIFSLTKRADIFDSESIVIQKKFVNVRDIFTEAELSNLIQNLKTTNEFAIDISDKEIHIANSKFQENIIHLKSDLLGEGIYPEVIFSALKEILENNDILKLCLNSKNLMRKLFYFDINITGIHFDANLALYLLSGSKKSDIDAMSFAERFGYDENNIATCLFASKQELLEKIENDGMTELYFNVELPLVSVLFEMEQNGFKINISLLEQMGIEYKAEIDTLSQQIYDYSGEVFNIKSPKQLGEILFDKLRLSPPKYMKKSTAAEVLERITDQHPIVEKIIHFRKIEKLYNTYIEPFQKMVDSNGFIHTIFNQTLTSTGRLSSSEPNLQNIPVRDSEGKNLRKIFIPRAANGKIITSDYSQIELRLLAHYSGDPKLLNAYKNGIDIHAETASAIFDVPLELVTPEMRRDAKSVNFGIIYGISDYGLANNINGNRKDAKIFMDKYFETYSHVKSFMDSSVQKAKELGYVTTLFGRKRTIDELKSDNYLTRQFGERAAMNMPLQGSASDIIKIAMINVYNQFKAQNLKSKLILQIHDELIVDAVPEEVEIVKQILKTQMESACKLNVPLIAQIEEGDNWFEAK